MKIHNTYKYNTPITKGCARMSDIYGNLILLDQICTYIHYLVVIKTNFYCFNPTVILSPIEESLILPCPIPDRGMRR